MLGCKGGLFLFVFLKNIFSFALTFRIKQPMWTSFTSTWTSTGQLTMVLQFQLMWPTTALWRVQRCMPCWGRARWVQDPSPSPFPGPSVTCSRSSWHWTHLEFQNSIYAIIHILIQKQFQKTMFQQQKINWSPKPFYFDWKFHTYWWLWESRHLINNVIFHISFS